MPKEPRTASKPYKRPNKAARTAVLGVPLPPEVGPHAIEDGETFPLGASPSERGTNFALWSHHATGARLLLYASATAPRPYQVITLDPERHRTFSAWHVFVVGVQPGTAYTWQLDGPPHDDTAQSGYRFDGDKELLDPWARAVSHTLWDREAARRPGPNGDRAMRSLVVRTDDYDWQGDHPPRLPSEDMIVYEVHVGGFTRHPSSGVEHPGTFSGLVEKIPYLQALGITHVELLPVQAFDEQDVPPEVAALGLSNFWGYSPHSFFAPHPGYCTDPDVGDSVREFRDMVAALHRAGIRVILDVVVNHTAEGNHEGPVIHFKGLGNNAFYHLDADDRRLYRDYTGCGNTLNCNHPVVSRFIVDYLEYWVREMHVDGFRFDLASVLARGEDGLPQHHAPAPYNIEFSSVLAHTKLIAEAWDAGGLYQVGTFPGMRWKEWNGRYRDTMRRFVRGEGGLLGQVATRLAGSNDLYEHNGRLPFNSINFVTCHDGFTLHDLVAYNTKHNEANGQNNQDGTDDHASDNCGVEGPSSDPVVLERRARQARNFMALLMLSQGIPMLLYGDEVLRSQQGNNNAYCQNKELAWFDWTAVDIQAGMLRFVRQMVALRKRHPSLRRRRFLNGQRKPGARLPDVRWYDAQLQAPAWDDPEACVLAFTLGGQTAEEADLHVCLNMGEEDQAFGLPTVRGRCWHRAVDTSRPAPDDIPLPEAQPQVRTSFYIVPAHSVLVFENQPKAR